MIEAVIFDIDGTLVDSKEASRISNELFYSEVKERLGDPPKKEISEKWRKTMRKYLQDFLNGKISFEELLITRIRDFFKLYDSEINVKEAKDIFSKIFPEYEKNVRLFEDVFPCLEELKRKGYKLAVISNGNSKDQREKLRKFAIDSYFSLIIISGDKGIGKPNPEIFQEALKALNIPAAKSMYVGDMIELDVLPANNVGMKGIWINRENRPTEHEVVSIFNLDALVRLLEED